MERLESEAKSDKRGLWTQADSTPPWDCRHGKGAAVTEEVVGNRNSRVFHTPNCSSVGRMKEENRVKFKAAEESKTAGYREAGDCKVRASPFQEC